MTYNVFGGTLNLAQSINHRFSRLLSYWKYLLQSTPHDVCR